MQFFIYFYSKDIGNIKDLTSNKLLQDNNFKDIKQEKTTNTFIYKKDDKKIFTLGTKNLIIYSDNENTIIADKEYTDEIANFIKKNKIKIDQENKEYRQWGYYQVINENKHCKIKKLFINPKSSTSLQYHKNRDEYQVILEGKARIIINDKIHNLKPSEGITIKRNEIHKIINPSKTKTLVILETQNGTKTSEEDIKRIENKKNLPL